MCCFYHSSHAIIAITFFAIALIVILSWSWSVYSVFSQCLGLNFSYHHSACCICISFILSIMASSNIDDETVQTNSHTEQRNNVDADNDANDCDLPYSSI